MSGRPAKGNAKRPPLRVLIIGWGSIARRVGDLLRQRHGPQGTVRIAAIAVRDVSLARQHVPEGAAIISRADELDGVACDLAVEAAGAAAVGYWGGTVLDRGMDLVVASTGALADASLLARLRGRAEVGGAKLIVPAGAVAGLDALRAAAILGLERVEHHIVKPPEAWRNTQAERMVALDTLTEARAFYRGPAGEAARLFPQNANVAATISLMGIGFERTTTVLVADPAARLNGHHIEAEGGFGRLSVRVENRPLASNPKSSELTALSLVELIESRVGQLAA